MDKYRRVEKPKTETEIQENEIRITTQGKMRNYITYATNLFQQKGSSEVVLKAMGRAINKAVTIAEIIKRRIQNLHQNTVINSTDITDVWEPIEEGLDRLETTRHVSSIQITLSTKPLDPESPGYQAPEEPKQPSQEENQTNYQPRSRRGRYNRGYRRGRGGNVGGNDAPHAQGEEGQQNQLDGPNPYRGRRRGGRRHDFNAPAVDQGNAVQNPGQNDQRQEGEGQDNQSFRGRGGRGFRRGGYRGRGNRGRGGPRRGGRGFQNVNEPLVHPPPQQQQQQQQQ
jgi:DNA-binding protein Alba